YAVSQNPDAGSSWGERGASTYNTVNTMVSTVGVNVQAESELKAELFGEVKINFASETLPLDRFADAARVALLERHARGGRKEGGREVATTSAPAEQGRAGDAVSSATPAPVGVPGGNP